MSQLGIYYVLVWGSEHGPFVPPDALSTIPILLCIQGGCPLLTASMGSFALWLLAVFSQWGA